MSEEKRREYYTYNPRNPATLFHHESPMVDLSEYNTELIKLAGRDMHGDPRIKISWAASIPQDSYYEDSNQDLHKYSGKKYSYLRLVKRKGCRYLDEDGNEVEVDSPEKVPAGKLFAFVESREDLGIMKYVVEMKYTLEELQKMKYYPSKKNDFNRWGTREVRGRRQRYAPLPSRRGEYMLAHYIETPDKQYKDISWEDVENIREIYRRAEKETDHEYAIRKVAETKMIMELSEQHEKEEFEKHLDQAIVRAERSTRGQIHYDQGNLKEK